MTTAKPAQNEAPLSADQQERQTTTRLVYSYLTALQPEQKFTGPGIYAALRAQHPEISLSGVGAYLSSLNQQGYIAEVGYEPSPGSGRRCTQYQIVDLSEVRVSGMKAREPYKQKIKLDTLASELHELADRVADRVAGMKTSLADYTMQELLTEIGRRTKGA